MTKRRTYHIIVHIGKSTDRPGQFDKGPSVELSRRSRLGIFCVNDWRAIAQEMSAKAGFEITSELGRRHIKDWDHIALVYGSFSKDGKGRTGSSLKRLPARLAKEDSK